MDLDAWLAERIGCEQRRAEVRANVDCLSDFRVASLEDLEDALGLAAWPALPKKRFLDAWRRLKDGEDEAAPSSEPQRPRSAPVSAAKLAAAARGPAEEEEEEEDDDDDDDAPTFARGPNGEMACEMRRVGDAEWRVFASRRDAARAFSISGADVSQLLNTSSDCSLRKRFEARNCAPPADAVNEPTANSSACEARRIGDKKWRRFASRTDAAAAFPGLYASDISKLINHPTKARSTIRGMYEARNVGDATRGARDSDSDDEEEDEDDEEDVGERAPSRRTRGHPRACEIRRVGDKKWRRFASMTDAVAAFPGLRDKRTVGRLITDNPRDRAPADIRKRFEARDVGDDAPRRPRSPPVSAAELAAAARGPPEDSDEDSEDEDDDEQGATRGKVLEMRRVGDKTWRKFRNQPDAEKAFGAPRGMVNHLINKTRKVEGFEARYVDGDVADVENHYGLAVGDRVTVGRRSGVVEALPELNSMWWKVRLDGEGKVRSLRRNQFTKADAAPVPTDEDDDDPRPPAPPRTFALPSLPADACELRRVGDADWRRFASRADAARAFEGRFGLDAEQIGKLIDDSPVKPSRERPKRTIRDNFEARAAVDSGAPFEAVPLEDECVICQKSTLEADDTPMQDVLLCDVCEGDVHLACTSLSKMPGDDDPFTCAACAATQGDDAAPPAPMDASPPAADDFDELYSEVAASAPAPAPAAADDDWGSASFGMSTAVPAPVLEASKAAPAPAPPTDEEDDDEAPPAKRARLDDLLGPPPADEAPAPAIPNDGSFLATMKKALAAAPTPAPPVLPVPAPTSPAPPPPAQPSSPASWPTLSDFDKSRVEALSHSCPAAAGRLAEALSRRAPVAPASPAPPIAQPAPPGTPDAAFQDAVAML